MTPPASRSHTATIRVRYADTDQMHIVYNGKYFEYFEVGRTEMLRSFGLPYAELEADGTRLPLIEAHCEYMQPARYDDLLLIESTAHDFRQARLRIDYAVRRERDGILLAKGHTIHAFQSIRTGKPTRPPANFLEAMERGPVKG